MSPPTLAVGEPAVVGGPPLPIEGARLVLNGRRIRVLIGYHEPTPSEIKAVRTAEVELGLFNTDEVAAVAIRAGQDNGHWLIETHAPLILPDTPLHRNGVGGDATSSSEVYPIELALCETDHSIVCALRRLLVPVSFVRAARNAAHAHLARVECVRTAIRMHERVLRFRTIRELMQGSEVRLRIPGTTRASCRSPE